MNEYPYPTHDNKHNVVCQLCGKGFIQISGNHLKKHNISLAEYKVRFPGIPLTSSKRKLINDHNSEVMFITDEEVPINEVNNNKKEKLKCNMNPVIDKEIIFESPSIVEIIKTAPDMCAEYKIQILNHLKTFFAHVTKDYMIQEFSLNGDLIYEVITDFADPLLKIDIEFPNTFWHNSMKFNNPNRTNKLKEFGWNIIEIKTTSPTLKKIERILMTNNIYK